MLIGADYMVADQHLRESATGACPGAAQPPARIEPTGHFGITAAHPTGR